LKRLLSAAVLTAALTMVGGYAALAETPEQAPAHGNNCDFGDKHSTKAKEGHIGGGGHVPGSHRGATNCP